MSLGQIAYENAKETEARRKKRLKHRSQATFPSNSQSSDSSEELKSDVQLNQVDLAFRKKNVAEQNREKLILKKIDLHHYI